jgi:hypothetical protein
MYGGEMEHASSPLFASNWHLQDTTSKENDQYIQLVDVKIQCSDGKTPKESEVRLNLEKERCSSLRWLIWVMKIL